MFKILCAPLQIFFSFAEKSAFGVAPVINPFLSSFPKPTFLASKIDFPNWNINPKIKCKGYFYIKNINNKY